MAPILFRMRSWVRARWRVAGALALVVALAGGAALTLVAGAVRTVSAPDRYSSWRGAEHDVSIQQASGRPRLAELEGLDAATRVEQATFVFGGLRRDGAEVAGNVLVFAGTQGPLGTRLVEGREPDPGQPGEFLATSTFVHSSGLRIGDTFDLVTLTQQQADEQGFAVDAPAGPALTATLVGVVDGPADLEDGYQVALFPASLLDEGDVAVAASVGVASLAPGATIDELRQQLDQLPDGQVFSLDRAQWVSDDIRAAVNAQGQGLLILGLIVAVTTVVVLGQLLTRQLRLAESERTALAAVGLSRGQLVAEPVCRAAIAVLAGAFGAAVLAYLCSGIFPVDFVRKVEPHPGRQLDPLVHLAGPALLAVGLLVWVRTALVLDARTTDAPRAETLTERVAAAVPSGQVSTALHFAFAPRSRANRSAVAPLVGLAVVFCVLFGALTFGANLRRLVDEPAQYGENFDVTIGAGEAQIDPDVQRALVASADVDSLTLFGTTPVAVGSASLDVVGMKPVSGSLVPEVRAGRLPVGKDEIALGLLASHDLGVGVGGDLEVAGASGSRKMRVTGIVLVPPIGGADALGHAALVAEDGFLAIDPEATMNAGAVRIAADAPPGALQRIGDLVGFGGAGPSDRPPAILNLHRIRTIPLLVAATVGALALLSLAHLMLVAVRRRRHDLAILRALGATPRWLSAVVHWQATITTAVVLVVAIPAGAIVGRVLYRDIVDGVGARTDAVLPVTWLGVTFGAVLVLANVVAAVPARRGARTVAAAALAAD